MEIETFTMNVHLELDQFSWILVQFVLVFKTSQDMTRKICILILSSIF